MNSHDTVLLYGIRWSDIPATGQAAIDAFAATHKVVIWDADDTGAQVYSNFVHPFSTVASGEGSPSGASVVSFPAIANALASDNPTSPYYLDPNQLVKDDQNGKPIEANSVADAIADDATQAPSRNSCQGKHRLSCGAP